MPHWQLSIGSGNCLASWRASVPNYRSDSRPIHLRPLDVVRTSALALSNVEPAVPVSFGLHTDSTCLR